MAEDLQTSELVALKVLSLSHISDWKMVDLFEQEAHILTQLNHPSIPRYLNYFREETSQSYRLYIAQQKVDGQSCISHKHCDCISYNLNPERVSSFLEGNNFSRY